MKATLEATAIQDLLDRGREAWLPRPDEPWDAFVRRKAPPMPPWWQPVVRGQYRKALGEALRLGERCTRQEAYLVPFWFGNNEDEVPRDDEWKRTFVLFSDGTSLLDIEAPEGLSLWAKLDVEKVSGSFVAASRAYAPGIPGVERFGAYAATEGLVRVIVKKVLAGEDVPATAAPHTMVPAFSMLVEPGVDLDRLPKDVTAAARALAERLQFVNEDENQDGR
jgi:hypothetical protein